MTTPESAPLSPEDVAAAVGVSVRTVYRYIEAGRLPAVNVSAGDKLPRWQITQADLDSLRAFLRGRRQGPDDAA